MRPRFLCIFLRLEHKLDELELLFAGSPQKKKDDELWLQWEEVQSE